MDKTGLVVKTKTEERVRNKMQRAKIYCFAGGSMPPEEGRQQKSIGQLANIQEGLALNEEPYVALER